MNCNRTKSVCTTGYEALGSSSGEARIRANEFGLRLRRGCSCSGACGFALRTRSRRTGGWSRWILAGDDPFNGSHEAIAAAGQGLNESGIAGRVSEGLADAIDGGVHAVLVVDEGAVGPQLAGDFLARQQLAGPLQEQQEHLEGLRVQLDADALPAQLSGGGVCFKGSEAIAPGWLRCLVMSLCPVYPISEFEPKQLAPRYNFSEIQLSAITCTVRNNLQQMRFHALRWKPGRRKVLFMTQRKSSIREPVALLSWAVVSVWPSLVAAAEPRPRRFRHSTPISVRLSRASPAASVTNGFLAPAAAEAKRDAPAAGRVDRRAAHACHGRGFARSHAAPLARHGVCPGAKAADFERLMRDFNAYPQHFSPQVLQAKVLAQQGDHFQATMRVRQQHVITVVMDTAYDVTFGRLDAQHGYSISRSTRISEIDVAGHARTSAR